MSKEKFSLDRLLALNLHKSGKQKEIRYDMERLQEICIEEGMQIGDAIRRLNAAGRKVLLVVKNRKLAGVITDGDIRRWVLKKGSFQADVSELMCREPRVVYEDELERAKEIMLRARIDMLPVLNRNDEVVEVVFIRDLLEDTVGNYERVDIPVVIMAGGKGTRLKPYTTILPKPLMPIGAKTILERIMDSFRKNGCSHFLLTLNYKKNLIKAYFDEKGSGDNIEYIEEEDFYGTCGSLSLLKQKIQGTFFLSNCDVLLDIDYGKLYAYHMEKQNEITAVTSLKHFQIPYGIFETEKGGGIHKMVEKPEYNFQVNAGIYVMEANVLKDIPIGEVCQMNDLINKLLEQKRKVGAYPVTENCWSDMGEPAQMQKMLERFY